MCTRYIGVVSLCAFAPLASAQQRLAFMQESAAGKHVVMADGNGHDTRPITSGTDWHLYPSISPSGNSVAYVEGVNGESLHVVVRSLETGVVERWTNRPGPHLHPRFSGDERFLAFSGPYGPGGAARVAIIDMNRGRAAGGRADALDWLLRPRLGYAADPEVIPSEFPCYFPAPSSDGSFVVFQRSRGKHKDVVLWDRSTKKLIPVTGDDGEYTAPALSWDDRLIAYCRREETGWQVIFTDLAANAKPVRVTDVPGRNLAPRFGPDGSLYFASDRTGRFQVYRIDAAEVANGTFVARLLVGGDGDCYAPSVSGNTTWSQSRLADLPDPARSSFGAVRLGTRIYVAGGHRGREHTYPSESFLADMIYLDTVTGRWHAAAPRSVPCHGFGMVGVRRSVGGVEREFVYAFGGFAYSADHNPRWKSLDQIERYDVAADRWETVGKLPRSRSSNVVARVGTKVYLIGGWDSTPRYDKDYDGRFHREVDVFDLETERAEATPHRLPDPLRRALSRVVVGDEIVLVGGLGQGASHFELLNAVTAFNPSTGVWRELPRLAFPTFAPAAGAIGDKLFVFGGMFKTGSENYDYVNHVYSLDPRSTHWRHTGRYLSETKGFSQVVPYGPRSLAILGGHSYRDNSDGPVRTIETFDEIVAADQK